MPKTNKAEEYAMAVAETQLVELFMTLPRKNKQLVEG